MLSPVDLPLREGHEVVEEEEKVVGGQKEREWRVVECLMAAHPLTYC